MRIAVASAAVTASAALVFKTKKVPRITCAPTPWNLAIKRLCPHLSDPYELPWILNNGHVRFRRLLLTRFSPRRLTRCCPFLFGCFQVETIFAALFRSNPHVRYEREIVTMPDGGVVALDSEASTSLPADAPVLILLPGLTGGSGDTYVSMDSFRARYCM